MTPTPTYISDCEVAANLTPQVAYDAVSGALAAHAKGLCVQPLKQYVRPGGRDNEFEQGRLICMPACINIGGRILGVKLIAGFPRNVRYGLPRASGLVILFDPVTGFPIAVMDCATLSARRTGAVAAICFDRFGSQDETVAIIGAGPISHEVILALNAGKRRVSRFRLFDLDRERAEKLRMTVAWQLHSDIHVAAELELCLRGATTVIAATTGSKEYIDPAHLDACRLTVPLSLDDFKAETLLSTDKLVVDEFDGCAREEKLFHRLVRDGRLTRDKVYAELGQVVAGMKPGRTGGERVFANLMGMGCEDISVAKAVYDKILENEALDQQIDNNEHAICKHSRTIPINHSSWWR
jgi:ornithine cyclodeaminase